MSLTDLPLAKDGSDRWIRENWHKFEGSGPTVRLHAAPAVGMLAAEPFIALALIVGFAFEVDSYSHKKGFAHRSAPSDPPDATQPGIEFEEEDDPVP